jgi:iron(III) transport system substrate-binding protein
MKVEVSMHSRISRRTAAAVAVLVAVAVALVGATAGDSASQKAPPPTPAVMKQIITTLKHVKSVKQREAILSNYAAKEGNELNFYTSLTSLSAPAVVKAFNAVYPDIKVNLFRGSSEDVTAKVLAERNAHAKGGDVVETNGSTMLVFQHFKDVLVPYAGSPYRLKEPKAYRFDTWTADRLEKFVLAWNTNLVKPEDVPTSWSDLADPKWKGKLALEPTDDDWFAAIYTWMKAHGGPGGKPLTQARLDAIWRGIGSNAQLINGHTTMSQLLAAGQFSIAVNGHAQSLEQLQAKKAPVAFNPFMNPVIDRPQGVGIPYSVEHPGAALLFYDFLLSPAGQKVLVDNGVAPAWAYKDNAFASNPPTVHMDLRPIVSHLVAWSKKYDSFTRLGKG